MKHIDLDQQDERVKQFFLSLDIEPDGSILETQGQPILRVLPISEEPFDKAKLEEAIINRRDESLAVHEEWAAVDRETWDQPDSPNE